MSKGRLEKIIYDVNKQHKRIKIMLLLGFEPRLAVNKTDTLTRLSYKSID